MRFKLPVNFLMREKKKSTVSKDQKSRKFNISKLAQNTG